MNEQHRAIVVEDERLPRMELCSMLAGEPTVAVVGEAASVHEARALIGQHQPDVVFLDIQLGSQSGFDLLRDTECSFDVIFVTAYSEHAVRAFEFSALDYLLKPVNPARLREAVGRIGRPAPRQDASDGQLDVDDRLFVKVDHRWRFLRVGDITWIEALGDYSRVHVRDGTVLLLPKSLREWETRLPPQRFVRIHRSTMINLDDVERVDEWSSRTFQVFVRNRDEPLQMSRRYAARLRS